MRSSSSSTNPSQPSTSTVISSLRSILPHPSQMDESSYDNDPNLVDNTSTSLSSSSSTNRFSDHQLHLINRSNDNCPSELGGSKRTNWLNAGKKAKQNFAVISSAPPFLWPTIHYDAPIFINHCTTELTLISSLQRISDVHLFTIDTESDFSPGKQRTPRPALLQIQAIHDENHATVFLLEVQHLPSPSSALFSHIQHLCHTIFSSNNRIMAWGDVLRELHPFSDFHFFDISQVVKITNLQEHFTHTWNQKHPHTSKCLTAITRASSGRYEDDLFVSAILHDDDDEEEDDDFGGVQIINKSADSEHCICPATSRPYKVRGAQWQLQRAVHLCLNRALDKSLTLKIWSCGLDPALNPSLSFAQRTERDNMILYAINDVFAPTHLYFHLLRTTSSSSISFPSHTQPTTTSSSSSSSTTTTRTTSIVPLSTAAASTSTTISQSTASPPLIVIVADSHFKFLPSNFHSNTYRLSTHVRSGLSWINPYDSNLCATTLLRSNSLSSSLSSAAAVFLFVGTNSIRCFPAHSVIEQVQDIISYLRSTHPHLVSPCAITINLTFPCLKPTMRIPTIQDLSTNITNYNRVLVSLSHSNNFSILEFPISSEHLYTDGMHILHRFNYLLTETLHQHIDRLIPSLTTPHSNQLPSPLITVTDTTPVIPPYTTSTLTSNINPSSPHQYAHVDVDVVELTIPSDEELDPPTSTQPDLVQSHLTSQTSHRSVEAKQRRNKKRHEKQKQQSKDHSLRRQVHPSWSIPQIRNFLLNSNISFRCVNPRRGNTVTILFRTEEQRQYADVHLSEDIFDESHHARSVINHFHK